MPAATTSKPCPLGQKKRLFILVLVLGLNGLPSASKATELSGTHVDLGYIDTFAGLTPAPGLYFRDDTNVVVSGRYNDRTGHRASLNLSGLGGGQVPLRFRNTSESDIVSIVYVPDWKIPYLNATIGTAAYEAIGNSRAGLTSSIGFPQSRANSKAGFGDITVVPVFLALANLINDVHVILAPFDFTAPTGRYSKTDPIGNNAGLNYFSYRPALEVTYLNKTGQEISLNINGSINAQNQATGYKSGNEFSFTYALEQHLSARFTLGLEGYYYRQVSSDVQHGMVVDTAPSLDLVNAGPGHRGETFAFGPLVGYFINNDAMIQAHWDHEAFSYDRPQRDQLFARVSLRF